MKKIIGIMMLSLIVLSGLVYATTQWRVSESLQLNEVTRFKDMNLEEVVYMRGYVTTNYNSDSSTVSSGQVSLNMKDSDGRYEWYSANWNTRLDKHLLIEDSADRTRYRVWGKAFDKNGYHQNVLLNVNYNKNNGRLVVSSADFRVRV